MKRYRHYLADNPQGYWFKKGYPWGWTPTGWGSFFVSFTLIICGLTAMFSIEGSAEYGDRMFRLFVGFCFFGSFYYLAAKTGAPEANVAGLKFWYDEKYDQVKVEANSYVRLVTNPLVIFCVNVLPIVIGVAVGLYLGGT